MQKVRKIGSGVLFGSMIFLLFLVVFEGIMHIPSWLAVAGRMHPMFLHFPIVLLLISFFTVWIPVSKENEWLDILRLIAALSAVITAIMGMLLSMEDGRTGDVLQLHKWAGVMTAIFGFLFYSYYPLLAGKAMFVKPFTLLATITIIITGHWGADLTHGEDYVLAPIKKNEQRLVAPEEAVIFADIIKPILDKKCVSCHSESSIKGGLLLESIKGLQAGGKTGPLFIPGQPDTSLMMKRIHLPAEDKKHMPPPSKPQLTETEEAILYAWIKSGAITDAKLFSLAQQDSFRILATAYLKPGNNEHAAPTYNFEAADEKLVASLNNNYRTVMPLGKNSPALAVNFYGRNIYNGKLLEEMLPLKKQIVEMSLSRLPVKDDDIKFIQQMENLRKLNLNYTDVTAKGAELLITLQHLDELTLSGTGVTAPALEKLLASPSLTAVYIWDTKIDSTQLKSLKARYAKVNIESGFVDNGGVMTALSPPIIKTPPGVFDDNVSLELKHPFKGVEIRYTLDGSQPDSVTGEIYKDPVKIDKNTTIIAKAYKPGWYGSGAVQASFIHRSATPDSVILASAPNPKYGQSNAKILTDGALGDFNNFGNGEWYGYQGTEAVYYLLFNKPITTKSISVNMMQNLGGQIFPPEKVEIWGGTDKDHLKLLGKTIPPAADKEQTARLLQERVTFDPAEVKFIKVVAQAVRKMPAWHGAKGKPAWIFISEVIVD